MPIMTFRVEDIHCERCARAIEQALCDIRGVIEVETCLTTGEVRVVHDGTLRTEDVRIAVREAGFESTV